MQPGSYSKFPIRIPKVILIFLLLFIPACLLAQAPPHVDPDTYGIDPETGKVVGWIDLTGILGNEKIDYPIDVMNGIAYDPNADRLFITGKLWPQVFEIRLLKKAD